jgi:hypothetical protein
MYFVHGVSCGSEKTQGEFPTSHYLDDLFVGKSAFRVRYELVLLYEYFRLQRVGIKTAINGEYISYVI